MMRTKKIVGRNIGTVMSRCNRHVPAPSTRAAYFAPVVTSTVALSMVWSWIYHPEVGLLNAGLDLVGLPPVRWLSDPGTALWAIVAMSVWKSLG